MVGQMILVGVLLASLSACSSNAQVKKDVDAYFAAVCEKEGYPKGTPENAGCVRVKLVEGSPQKVRGGSGRMSTTCTPIGNSVHCN